MKKPIRILNIGMDIVGEIDNYESMFFIRSWHGIGSIELRINRYKKHADALIKNNLILVGNDLSKVFIIKHREIELDENGKITENWLIKGYALKSIIAQRITMPPPHTAYDNRSGNAETVMKHYINNNLVNPVDGRRKIPNLVIAPNLQRGMQIAYSSRFKNLAEEMSTLSLASGLGWDVTLDIDNKVWIFDVMEGRNLIASQSILPPVIFSPQFESLKSLHYTQSDLNYKNVAIVAGQGEGVERREIEVGDYDSINRHEIFIDARDVAETDDNEQAIPEQLIIQALTDRGQQQLSELIQEEYLEGQILMGTKTEKVPKLIDGNIEDVRLKSVDLLEYRNLQKSILINTTARGETQKLSLNSIRFTPMTIAGSTPYIFFERLSNMDVGIEHTISFILKSPIDKRVRWSYGLRDGGFADRTIFLNPNEEVKVIFNFIPTGKNPRLILFSSDFTAGVAVILSELKIEKGSAATAWQPAPEDNISWYHPTKTIELNPINLSRLGRYQSSQFNYDIDTPIGTAIKVEYSFDNQTFHPLHSGDSLPFNEGDWLTEKVLYLRQTLYTTDQSVTPTIKNFRYNIRGYSIKETVTTATFQYEVDYDYGDITTIQNLDWGITMDARITEIKEIYEATGFSIEATFGNSRPTLIQKIKQELNQISGEVRR